MPNDFSREDIVGIVREVQQPFHEENLKRFRAIEEARVSDTAALAHANDSIGILQTNDSRLDSRLTRVEVNVEALVGSRTVEGMVPKMSADLQGEFSRSAQFRHDMRGSLDNIAGRLLLMEAAKNHLEGELAGQEKVREKVADWVKWAAGGLASAGGLFLLDVAKHYLGWK